MVEQSGSERIGVRFGAYIDELRAFFSSRGVRFGSPDDVVAFAERVASPGPFQDEMGSMVRSIQFREDDSLGRGEMLELVSVAVGGPAVEAAAQTMHASVRQIFVFVNQALRQRSWDLPAETVDLAQAPVTVGQILAAQETRQDAEDWAVADKASGNGVYRAAGAGRGNTTDEGTRRGIPGESGILFKAVSMSEDESAFPSYGNGNVPITRRPWFIPAAVAAVVVASALLYVSRPAGNHPAATPQGGPGVVQTQSQPVSAAACVAPSTVSSSRAGLENRLRWAHGLLDQKMYDAALPELRQVAQMDPSYPGINLDESNALLQLKRPEDARDAADAQIGISDCLSKLPGAALDAYCSAEFAPSTVGGCRAQLAHIRQAAELQAALVHLELGHRAAPDTGAPEPALTEAIRPAASATVPEASRATAAATVPLRAPRVHRSAPLPPATEDDNGQAIPVRSAAAKPPAAPKQDRKIPGGDDALRRGEGTDSAFGAYSKPQD